jgi:nitrite reductase (NADH) large subunit
VSGDPVVAIDRDSKVVTALRAASKPYDRLLIATGSDPFIIPVPGKDLAAWSRSAIWTMWTRCWPRLLGGQRGGHRWRPAGLEAAHGLSLRGMAVTVIHLMSTLMERQLDEAAGWLLKSELERRGQVILTSADTAEILGEDGKVTGVRLKDGREIPAHRGDGGGHPPSTALAKAAGLQVERGIVVDDHMVTSDPAIMAVGECVQHRGVCYGLVAPLWEMCRSLADAPPGRGAYTGSVTSTKLKVSGIDLFSAGDFRAARAARTSSARCGARGLQARGVKDNKLVGAVLYGDTADGSWYFDLLKKGEDIADIREALIFGQAFARAAPSRTLMPPLLPFRMMPKSAAATAFPKARWWPPSSGRRSLDAVRAARPAPPADRAPGWWKACWR